MSSWIHPGLKQSVSCRELMGVIGTSELGPPPPGWLGGGETPCRWEVGGNFRAAGAL